MTYELPAIGKPADRPMLEKIAVEEHFDALGAAAPPPTAATGSSDEDLQSLVRAMDYNAGWMSLVGARLKDFGADRLAGIVHESLRLG